MRKVLIPLDGSAFGRQILNVVRDYFRPQETELVLLRVALPLVMPGEPLPVMPVATAIGPTGVYSSTAMPSYVWSAEEKDRFRTQLLDEMQPEAAPLRQAGYRVTTEVRFGDPAEEIIRYVQEAKVDLVAMTTHGRTGLGRLVMGSVAENVLRHSTVPVLLLRTASPAVVKSTAGEELLHSLNAPGALHLVVATDGSTFSQAAVKLAGEVAQSLHARLTVLVVGRERDDSAQRQQLIDETVKLVAGQQPQPALVPLVGYTDEVVLDYLDKHRTQLLMLGAFDDRGAGPVQTIGLTAQRIVQQTPISVLVSKGHTLRLRKILACVDRDDALLVQTATALARQVGADCEVVHVAPRPAEAEQQDVHLATAVTQWQTQLAGQGFDRQMVHVRYGPVSESILTFAREGKFDLIVIGSRASPGHFPNTTAHQIVSFAEQPVLLVRTRSL